MDRHGPSQETPTLENGTEIQQKAYAASLRRKVGALPVCDTTAEDERRRQREQVTKRSKAFLDLVTQAGERYRSETFDSFRVESVNQKSVRARLLAECQTRDSFRSSIVLYGPCGTGKDHLLFACASAAVGIDRSVRWTSGLELYLGRRELIGRETTQTERGYLKQFAWPDILVISDPVPDGIELKNFARETLYMVVDARYRDGRPTWVSVNVRSKQDAAAVMGAPVIDRLSHGSIVLHCNWESYRKAAK